MMFSTASKRGFIDISIFSSDEDINMSDTTEGEGVVEQKDGEGKENRVPVNCVVRACRVMVKKLRYSNTSKPITVTNPSTTPGTKCSTNSCTPGSITNTFIRAGTTSLGSKNMDVSMNNAFSTDSSFLLSCPAAVHPTPYAVKIGSISSFHNTPISPPNMSSTPQSSPTLSHDLSDISMVPPLLGGVNGGHLRGGRSGGRGRGGGNRNQWDRRSKVVAIDTEDPVQSMFGQISKVLDYRQDKRERIIKLSRDITIESKRIIFCLHRIKSEKEKATVLGEAECRLMDMKVKLWYYLARELKGEDHYQFIRAYSAGLQEWVEALSFYHYLAYDKLILFNEVEKELVFEDKKAIRKMQRARDEDNSEKTELADGQEVGNENETQETGELDKKDDCIEEMSKENDSSLAKIMISVTVPQSEFILGLADLTGELMRNAINSLGSGNMDVCFTLLDILQSMLDGFTMLPKYEAPKDIGQKMFTLKQSCKKVENACYAISVRGSEIPKGHLADIFYQRDDGQMDKRLGGGEEMGEEYFG